MGSFVFNKWYGSVDWCPPIHPVENKRFAEVNTWWSITFVPLMRHGANNDDEEARGRAHDETSGLSRCTRARTILPQRVHLVNWELLTNCQGSYHVSGVESL